MAHYYWPVCFHFTLQFLSFEYLSVKRVQLSTKPKKQAKINNDTDLSPFPHLISFCCKTLFPMSQIDPRTIKKVIARHPFFPREKNIWSPSSNESLLQPNTQLPVLSFPCSFYLWLASCQLASACRQLAVCSPIHLDLSFEVSFFTCVLTSSSFFRSCQYILQYL